MEIIYLKNIEDVKEISNTSLVLGNFDGVHVGHVSLINFAKNNSRGPLTIFTFDKTIKNNDGFITSLNDKIDIFKYLQVDYLLVVKVDENFKKMSYVDFVDKILKKINPKKIFCGSDFKYGFEAKGDVSYLKERFDNVLVLNFVNDNLKNKISSSEIRKLIKEGNIKEANRFLGREFKIKGKVIKGEYLGNKIGFPTANLSLLDNYILPNNGVYLTKTLINNKTYYSMTNVGYNPTVNSDNEIKIETYILDFNEELYGKEISILFLEKMREEIKFANLEELTEQLKKDKKIAEDYFEFNL